MKQSTEQNVYDPDAESLRWKNLDTMINILKPLMEKVDNT